MAATLEAALLSIISQVDNSYQVLVVDDGSSDNSISILRDLQKRYSNFNAIFLQRDSRRKLGDTRNISIKAAKGEFVIMHIDADDIWDYFIPIFTSLFHDISSRLEHDNFYLSGCQIQMAKRSFMLDHPYPNVYYCEDRILWSQLASIGALISVDHKLARRRIPLAPGYSKITKALTSQYSSLVSTFATSARPRHLFCTYLRRFLLGTDSSQSPILRLYLLLILLPSYFSGVFILRLPRIDQFIFSFRQDTLIDLRLFEDIYLSTHGKFSLDSSDRKLFFL